MCFSVCLLRVSGVNYRATLSAINDWTHQYRNNTKRLDRNRRPVFHNQKVTIPSRYICWNFCSLLYSLVGAKVPHLELSHTGVNGLGSEKSSSSSWEASDPQDELLCGLLRSSSPIGCTTMQQFPKQKEQARYTRCSFQSSSHMINSSYGQVVTW